MITPRAPARARFAQPDLVLASPHQTKAPMGERLLSPIKGLFLIAHVWFRIYAWDATDSAHPDDNEPAPKASHEMRWELIKL